MAKFFTKRIEVEAEKWAPGKEIEGVVEETKVAKGSEPEVTHGLMLLPGLDPIKLRDKDGNPVRAKVGDVISSGRGHIDTPDGHTIFVTPGDWVVKCGDKIEAFTDEEFHAKFDAAS